MPQRPVLFKSQPWFGQIELVEREQGNLFCNQANKSTLMCSNVSCPIREDGSNDGVSTTTAENTEDKGVCDYERPNNVPIETPSLLSENMELEMVPIEKEMLSFQSDEVINVFIEFNGEQHLSSQSYSYYGTSVHVEEEEEEDDLLLSESLWTYEEITRLLGLTDNLLPM